MPRIVSFDFDGTLSRSAVQRYAKHLVAKGYDVWICTSRCESMGWVRYDNSDLFAVAADVGIPYERIIFTRGDWKVKHLPPNTLLHIDNDPYELAEIRDIPIVDIRKSWSLRRCANILAEWESLLLHDWSAETRHIEHMAMLLRHGLPDKTTLSIRV